MSASRRSLVGMGVAALVLGAAAGVVATTSAEPSPPDEAPSEALAPGTVARVGDWEVTVRATNAEARHVVVGRSALNDGAPPDRRYVIGELAVSYAGAGERVPWEDLRVRFVGARAVPAEEIDGGVWLVEDRASGADAVRFELRTEALDDEG